MFENVLLESARQKGKSQRAMTLPVSIAVHGLVIGLFLGASLWFVEEVPEPPIPVIFYTTAAPPPPPPPAQGTTTPRIERARPISRMEVPILNLETGLRVSDTPESDARGTTDGSEGGDPQGDRDGVSGGVRDSVWSAIDPDGRTENFTVGGDVKAPRLVVRVEPTYPEAARKARIEGVVILEAIITPSGSVEQARVVKSVHPLLDDSAQRALLQWRYGPATLNGRPVRVYLTVTVSFILH